MPPKKTPRHQTVKSTPASVPTPIRRAFVYPRPSSSSSSSSSAAPVVPTFADFPVHQDAHCIPSRAVYHTTSYAPPHVIKELPEYKDRCDLFEMMFKAQMARRNFVSLLFNKHDLARTVRRGSQSSPLNHEHSATSVSQLIFLNNITVSYMQPFVSNELQIEMSKSIANSVNIAIKNAVLLVMRNEQFCTELATIVVGDPDLTFILQSVFFQVLPDYPAYFTTITKFLRQMVFARTTYEMALDATNEDTVSIAHLIPMFLIGRISEAIAMLRVFDDIYRANMPTGYRYLEWLVGKSAPSPLGVERPCDQIVMGYLLIMIEYGHPEHHMPALADDFTEIRNGINTFHTICGVNRPPEPPVHHFMTVPDEPAPLTPVIEETDDETSDSSDEASTTWSSPEEEAGVQQESELSSSMRRHFGLAEPLNAHSPDLHVTPAQVDLFNRSPEPYGREPLSPLFPDVTIKSDLGSPRPGLWSYRGSVFLANDDEEEGENILAFYRHVPNASDDSPNSDFY